MAEGSIINLIAGFLPPAADPAPTGPDRTNLAAATTAPQAVGSKIGGDVATSRRRRAVHMICFSKDRAFQLDQLLESSERHLQVLPEQVEGVEEPVRLFVSVLYLTSASLAPASTPLPHAAAGEAEAEVAAGLSSPRSSRTMEESYDLVRRRHPRVRFVPEEPGKFCDQLRSLIGEEAGSEVPAGRTGDEHEVRQEERFVLFAVDDMFFYRDFELPAALRLLARDRSTFCVHLRLHPGITWSHTAGLPCNVPPLWPTSREVFTSAGTAGSGTGDERSRSARATHDCCGSSRRQGRAIPIADLSVLTFIRKEGTGEWDYPWDLTGGLYRREDAAAVIDGIMNAYGKNAAANPNLLEFHGHALLQGKELPRIGGGNSGNSSNSSATEAGAVAASPCAATTGENADGGNGGGQGSSSVQSSFRSPAAAAVPAGSASSSLPPCPAAPLRLRAGLEGRIGSTTPLSSSRNSAAAAAALAAAANAARAAPRCGCSGRAVVSSLAVNRVQSTYSTPVYASRKGSVWDLDRRLRSTGSPLLPPLGKAARGSRAEGGEVVVPEITADPRWGKEEEDGEAESHAARERGGFDGAAYRRRVFNSVHVGELWFEGNGAAEERLAASRTTARSGGNTESGSASMKPGCATETQQQQQQYRGANTVTVLLPVRNGGDHLVDAVGSVLSCAWEMPPGWGVELLVIDDGSEDGAVERAVTAVCTANTAARRERSSERDLGNAGDGQKQRGCRAVDANEGGRRGGEKKAMGQESEGERGEMCTADREKAVEESSRSYPPSLGTIRRGRSSVDVRVIRHERTVGLAESLNEGLREARGDLVARMDADDVCMPGRLQEQVAYMLEHPRVSVLGTSVATFNGQPIRGSGGSAGGGSGRGDGDGGRRSGDGDGGCGGGDDDGGSNPGEQLHQKPPPPPRPLWPGAEAVGVHLPAAGVQRLARHPTDPAFLAWSMLFGCCLAHPSAMLRRDHVVGAGGYDPSAEPAEDYDLWLRLGGMSSASNPGGCIANLGEVLMGVRKHDQNVSRQRRQEQGAAADAAAARAMTRLLERRAGGTGRMAVTLAQAAAVRRPESAASARDVAEAARLLGDLGVAAAAAAEAVQQEDEKEETRSIGVTSSLTTVAASPKTHDDNSGHDTEDDGRRCKCEDYERRRRGRKMIAVDVEARLGAMAVHAMSRFGVGAAPVLEEWGRQYSERPLLFALGGGR